MAHLKKIAHGFRVMRKRFAQDLDGDLTVEPCIEGEPDFAHPTCAERREDIIWPKMGAGIQSYFFAPAVQLTTTVSGALGMVSTIVLNRNFCPSLVTE